MGGVIFLLFSCLGTYVILTAWISTKNSAQTNITQQTEILKHIAKQEISCKNIASLKTLFGNNNFYTNGYPFIIYADGEITANDNSDKSMLPSQEILHTIEYNTSEEINIYEIENQGETQVFYYSYSPDFKGNIVTWYYQRDMMKMPYILTTIIVIVGIFTMAFIIVMIGYVARTIVTPLNKSIAFASAVAAGNLTTQLNVYQTDETGKMANALRSMADRLAQIVSTISGGATTIATATGQMSSSSEGMSQSVAEQASAIEEITATLEQMTAGLQQVSTNAKDAENIAIEAGESMQKVEKSSDELVNLTTSIIEKANIISHISVQTRILSLNAAVEAARAGEFGRGFSVVASEVRKLSDQSARASEEIEAIIAQLIASSEETGTNIKELIPRIEKNLEMVRSIASSTEEHSTGASQINSAILTINAQTQNNSSAADEMASAALEIASQSNQLKERSNYFITEKTKTTQEEDNNNSPLPIRPVARKIKMTKKQAAAYSSF